MKIITGIYQVNGKFGDLPVIWLSLRSSDDRRIVLVSCGTHPMLRNTTEYLVFTEE